MECNSCCYKCEIKLQVNFLKNNLHTFLNKREKIRFECKQVYQSSLRYNSRPNKMSNRMICLSSIIILIELIDKFEKNQNVNIFLHDDDVQ